MDRKTIRGPRLVFAEEIGTHPVIQVLKTHKRAIENMKVLLAMPEAEVTQEAMVIFMLGLEAQTNGLLQRLLEDGVPKAATRAEFRREIQQAADELMEDDDGERDDQQDGG